MNRAILVGREIDISNMASFLRERGFKEEEITLLSDPTTEQLVAGLDELVKAKPGDKSYFHYSGKGAQVRTDTLTNLQREIREWLRQRLPNAEFEEIETKLRLLKTTFVTEAKAVALEEVEAEKKWLRDEAAKQGLKLKSTSIHDFGTILPTITTREQAANWLVEQISKLDRFPFDEDGDNQAPIPTAHTILADKKVAELWIRWIEDGDWETEEEKAHHKVILDVWHILLPKRK